MKSTTVTINNKPIVITPEILDHLFQFNRFS